MKLGGTFETSTSEVKSLLRLRFTLTSALKFEKFKCIRPAKLGLLVLDSNYLGASTQIIRIQHES
jgi:hypothetical protein